MMSINTEQSKNFISNFRKRWGYDRIVGDPQNQLITWFIYEKRGRKPTFENAAVRKALIGITFNAPQGPIEVMQIITYRKR